MNTTNATTTTTKRMLGSLSSAEQYDDFKWKSMAKLITEGLWQPIAEGQKPPHKMNARLWGALVEACDGEALQVATHTLSGLDIMQPTNKVVGIVHLESCPTSLL